MRRTPRRWLGLLPVLLLVAPLPAQVDAQEEATEERTVAHIYEAFYKVNYADLPEWNRQFEAYAVPVLEELRSEGVIEGWGHWQHNVGSEYNIRFAVRVYDWPAMGVFWSEYLGRMFGSMPPEEQAIASGMIEAHRDEIWNLGPTRFAEGMGPMRELYSSTFKISFGDMEEWNRIWTEAVFPVLDEAMDAGILNGVVLLGHNTGGAHNQKVLYLFDSWDDMDDMWAMFFEGMEEHHPDDFMKLLSMVQAHDDVIWTAAPGEGEGG